MTFIEAMHREFTADLKAGVNRVRQSIDDLNRACMGPTIQAGPFELCQPLKASHATVEFCQRSYANTVGDLMLIERQARRFLSRYRFGRMVATVVADDPVALAILCRVRLANQAKTMPIRCEIVEGLIDEVWRAERRVAR